MDAKSLEDGHQACDFCERPVHECRHLIVAARAAICDECIRVCLAPVPPPPDDGEPEPLPEALAEAA